MNAFKDAVRSVRDSVLVTRLNRARPPTTHIWTSHMQMELHQRRLDHSVNGWRISDIAWQVGDRHFRSRVGWSKTDRPYDLRKRLMTGRLACQCSRMQYIGATHPKVTWASPQCCGGLMSYLGNEKLLSQAQIYCGAQAFHTKRNPLDQSIAHELSFGGSKKRKRGYGKYARLHTLNRTMWDFLDKRQASRVEWVPDVSVYVF
ncbi:uncharacterized protein BDW43DRAFT_59947 [Aspergillus alliaceus]|uniref:uncharacterized protein n=1 Tax=Petromyces alliaceus TaxID=209559 RepID=UPI0012A661B2|nr:uncharacterized protein BDW43DRAFT_59947 [Aspergillus alliaceus]KAB8234344.1 hypothetical protein BDW43DRAFT_59947 [Aspergillus alliaceus]